MFVGIDLGTTSVKTILVDESGTTLGSMSEPVAVSRPRPGWSEQDPEHWWDAVVKTLDGLKARHPAALAAVKGIGLSGHMHGATLLDAQDRVLRPAILWNDGRSADECLDIEAGTPEARAITGNIAMPGFTAPKLAWVRRHEPDIFAAGRQGAAAQGFRPPAPDRRYVSDMSDAAGTYWLDVGKRDWSDALLAATGLDRSHMPRLAEGTEATGRLLPDPRGALGHGRRRPWWRAAPATMPPRPAASGRSRPARPSCRSAPRACCSCRTSASRPTRKAPCTRSAMRCPDTWHQMGVILSATDSLNWLSARRG